MCECGGCIDCVWCGSCADCCTCERDEEFVDGEYDCMDCGVCETCTARTRDFHEEMEKALALDQKKLEDLGAFEGPGHKVPRLRREHFRGTEGQRYGVDDPEER